MAFDLNRYTGSYALDSYTLRGMDYATQRAAKAKRSAFLAAAREAKRAVQRTCQICARPIFAETGLIAHHGYTRPGGGWQTPSCEGARELPFEKSRDVLGAWLIRARAQLSGMQQVLKRMTDAPGFLFNLEWTEYTDKRDAWNRRLKAERSTPVSASTDWEKLRAEFPAAFHGRPSLSFEQVKRSAIMTQERNCELLARYIDEQQTRFDAWSQVES